MYTNKATDYPYNILIEENNKGLYFRPVKKQINKNI